LRFGREAAVGDDVRGVLVKHLEKVLAHSSRIRRRRGSAALPRSVDRMWVPRTEAEVLRALQARTLTETASFEAKAQMPPPGKNKDLAKDLCAMTVEGGVLLYGVSGEDPTRPDTPTPFDLAGAAERIDQVAQTGISEPPSIEILDILSDEQPGKGYLAVSVPPSSRSPHMLILGGDNRYWARGATGNRLLTEGEVARLYERRERLSVDRDRLLSKARADAPFEFELDGTVGPMAVVVRSVTSSAQLLKTAAGELDVGMFIQRTLLPVGRFVDPYPDQGSTGLDGAHVTTRRGAGVWRQSAERDLTHHYQAVFDLSAAGQLTYWHSPTVNSSSRRELPMVLERSVTRAVQQALGTMGWLYDRAGYRGVVDVGVVLWDVEHACGASTHNAWEPGPEYGAPEYRQHDRVTAGDLLDRCRQVSAHLVAPLCDVISLQGYDPFGEARPQPPLARAP
jgi:hypothetical protein